MLRPIVILSFILITFSSKRSIYYPISVKKESQKSDATKCIKGAWEGYYLTNQFSHPPTPIKFAIFDDGTVLIKSTGVKPAQNEIYCSGNWTFDGNNLKINVVTLNYSSEVSQIYKFELLKDNILGNGMWENLNPDKNINYSGQIIDMKRASCEINCETTDTTYTSTIVSK